MKHLNILVTGIGGGGVGEQVIKALRLSSLQFTLYGSDTTPISKGFKEVDTAFILPPASSPEYLDQLMAACQRYQIHALFPGSEPELKVIGRHRDRLTSSGLKLFMNPNAVLDICLDKNKTTEFFNRHQFHYPKSLRLASLNELAKVDFLPAILKPAVGSGGSANIMIAQNKEELQMFASYLIGSGIEIMAQEYVGLPTEEYTVGILCSLEGEIMNSIVLKRNITSGLGFKMRVPNRSGKAELGDYLVISSGISQGEIIPRSFINDECENIVKALGCTSSVNIQCRVVDKKVFVFEINPRFSGTTSLRALVGYNEPEILIRKELWNEPLLNKAYKTGHIVRGLSETYIG